MGAAGPVADEEPSFDEPNLKASFDFSIVIPESCTALSNQPEKDNQSVGDGLKKVTFVTAPKMSTYVRLSMMAKWTRVLIEVFFLAVRLGLWRIRVRRSIYGPRVRGPGQASR